MTTIFEKFSENLKEIMEVPGSWREKRDMLLRHVDQNQLSELISWFDGIAEESEDDEEDDYWDDDSDVDFFDEDDEDDDGEDDEKLTINGGSDS